MDGQQAQSFQQYQHKALFGITGALRTPTAPPPFAGEARDERGAGPFRLNRNRFSGARPAKGYLYCAARVQ